MKTITRTQKSGSSGLLVAVITTAFTVILAMGLGMTVQAANSGEALNTTTGATSTSIQAVIDHASTTDGHTIEVGDGTYTENVTIDKELTLEADNSQSATIIGSVTIETNNASSSNVILKDFVIDGTSGPANGVSITAAESSSFNGSATISGNEIKNFTRGILLDFNDPENSETVLISGNNIHDNTIGVNAQASVGDASIEITNNNIKNNDNGIDSAGTGVVLNQNNIVDNDNGLTNYSNSEFDAEMNWWGDDNGPATSSTSTSTDGDSVATDAGFPDGSVDYEPWLCGPFEQSPGNSDDGCDDDVTPVQCSAVSLEIVSDDQTMAGTSTATTTFEHSTWNADDSSDFDNANWIWESFNVIDPEATTTVTFTRGFTYNGNSTTSATLYIAADNSYSVSMNGNTVGATSSENNYTLSTYDAYDVSGDVQTGSNTLTFAVTNNAQDGATAQENTAGLLFKLTVDGELCEPTDVDDDEDNDEDTTPPSSGSSGGSGGGSLAPRNGDGDVAGDQDSNDDNEDDDDSNGEVLGVQDDDVMTDAELHAAFNEMTQQLRNLLAILQNRSIGFPNTGDGSFSERVFGW